MTTFALRRPGSIRTVPANRPIPQYTFLLITLLFELRLSQWNKQRQSQRQN